MLTRLHYRKPKGLLSFVLIWFLFSAKHTVAANNRDSLAAPLMTDYESVRALDEFGNAKQLQYATNAADQQASLVMILQHVDDTWILSIPSTTAAHHGGRPAHHRRSTMPLVQPLALPATDPSSIQNTAFLVCTGLQGDARWLTQYVRNYCSRLWETSDQRVPPTPAALATAVASLMRLFWGFPHQIAIASMTLQGVVSSARSAETTWARPLGLQVAVLALTQQHKPNGGGRAFLPKVYQINPSGNILDPATSTEASPNVSTRILCSMGNKNDAMRENMERNLAKLAEKSDIDTLQSEEALEDFLWKAIAEVFGSVQGRVIRLQVLTGNGRLLPERILER